MKIACIQYLVELIASPANAYYAFLYVRITMNIYSHFYSASQMALPVWNYNEYYILSPGVGIHEFFIGCLEMYH